MDPKSGEEFCQLQMDSRYVDIHKATAFVDNENAVMFLSDKMMLLIRSCKQDRFDGTFYTAAKISTNFHEILSSS